MTLLRYCVLRIATAHSYGHLGHRDTVGDHDYIDRVEKNLIPFQLSTLSGLKSPNKFLLFKIWNRGTALIYSSNIVRLIKSRRMRWTGHVAHMGDRRGVYKILVGKPERRKTLEKNRRRWKYNIKMNFKIK